MRISYAITVYNEHLELDELLTLLENCKDPEDEIIVQCDKGNTTLKVYKVLDKHDQKYIEYPLNNNFSNFKNNLKDNCNGDWIFQIDADELPSKKLLKYIKRIIKRIIKKNPDTDLLSVPRVNTVYGLRKEHINKWGWNLNNNGWVNWPDYQQRIILNNNRIKWVNKVHEKISGSYKSVLLPKNKFWTLYHFKEIFRQIQQKNYYDSL